MTIRTYPECASDKKDAEELNAEQWMIEALKMNPSYVYWGNYEDYMMGKKGQWSESLEFETWEKFGPWGLDELNEIVNFYFEVSRNSVDCPECNGQGYNQATRKISDEFYSFEDKSKAWNDKLTQDEVDALVEHGRIKKVDGVNPTAEDVNADESRRYGKGNKHLGLFGHDAINRMILIETRAKRLGVYGHCPECGGHGYIFTEEKGHLDLQLWVIHPRKGASRGIYIKNIQREESPAVMNYLRGAAERNAERFNGVM